MLTNSYIVHETVNHNMNQQLTEEFLYRGNFHTQEFTTMNNWDGNNYEKENHPLQWHVQSENRSFVPDEIVKNTNLRIEAEEFVPRYLNKNINPEPIINDVNQSALYGSSDGYTLVPNPEQCNKTSWADEVVENVAECLPDSNSEFYNAEVSGVIPLIRENENPDILNTVPTRSFEEFVGQNINFNESTEQLESHRYCSVNKPHLPEFNNTNQTEAGIDRTNQNRDNKDIDSYNRNFQPRHQHDKSNKEYNRNWNDENYRQKSKPRYSQSFREKFPSNRQEEPRDFRRNRPPNSYNQENESSYWHQDNEAKPNRRYSDRGKNQDRYHNYDKRRSYHRSSPNFIKNNNEGVETQGSTAEVKPNEEIHNDENNSNVTVEAATPDQACKSDQKDRSNIKRNQFRPNRMEKEADEEGFKRKWSDRQSYGNKEVEESKPTDEEKGAKPRNRNYQKGRFMDSRSSSNNSREYRDKKQDERQQKQQIEPAENTEIVESEQHKERKSKFYKNSEFKNRKPNNNNYSNTSNTEGFDEGKYNKERNKRTSNIEGFDEEKYNKERNRQTSNTEGFDEETNNKERNRRTSNTEGLDEEKYKKERNRRFTDTYTYKSIKHKTKVESYNDVEDKPRPYSRRSFNRDETEKRPEKSFRDALFAEKNNDKPRDLKQERGGIKVEITVRYEEFKNRPSAESRIEHLFDEKYAESDSEYKCFLQDLKDDRLVPSDKIKEQNQDLFKMPKDYSLAHCVAEDMRMGSGIAVTFRDTFGNVEALLDTKEKSGGIAILKESNRFLYYLITKRRSRDKPSYKDFWCSMKRLRDHIKKHKIAKLAVPTLGCGLDQLNWPTVKHIMGYLFKDIPIEIVVCNFTPSEDVPRNSIKIHRKYDDLKNAKESIIVYFTSADSHVSKEMLELDERFSFLEDFMKAPKKFGSVIESKVSDCILCGCVVRKTVKDPFKFKSFALALDNLANIIAGTDYDAIALQHLKDDEDDLLHQKIITLVVNYLDDVEVFVYMGQMDDSFGET